ncbi:hypothetical protein E2562_024935 [Oryza meyeriana var. granulata]|uniref:Uncharacterized protein n=1 Tax=Oryza meyeriana var. granulata TaxID=110450 RepID=A0A6G1DQ95_9ORYZ|nr:hypothetical protein E2562_024935 [Oryza meyeriana var. granulata]
MLAMLRSVLLRQWRLGSIGSRSLSWCLDWREDMVRRGGTAVRRERCHKSDEEGDALVVRGCHLWLASLLGLAPCLLHLAPFIVDV